MNKLSKEKRDRLLLVCIVIVAVLGGLYTFVLGAQKEKLADLQTRIAATKGKLQKAEVLLRSADAIESKLTENKKLITEREENMAPQGQYYYWFLKLIDQFRKNENLDTGFIMDITQPEFIEAGLVPQFQYKAASFGLRLNGHYHDIGRFVAAVENSFPYFRVQGMRIAPAGLGDAAKLVLTPGVKSDGKLIVELKIVTLIKPATT
jgi:Tfp pilus assembly protein PilO